MRTALIVVAILLLGVALAWGFTRGPLQNEEVACTMEAKICPDGSSVGRIPPSCEFAPCPTPQATCTKELKICPDGSSVGRVAPSCEFAACPIVDDMIIIDSPKPGETVTSPVTVTGKARGNWFFEASFPIVVVNWDGLIIGQGIATADGEWMTTEFVPFTGTISYTIASNTPYNRGAFIFKKDNPSGLPENDDAREIPVLFSEVTPQP